MTALLLVAIMLLALLVQLAPYLFLIWLGAKIVKWVFTDSEPTLTVEQQATIDKLVAEYVKRAA